MKKIYIIAFFCLFAFNVSADENATNELINNSEIITEWCHVQYDCNNDGLIDYWGDVDCEFEDDLREQYSNSCGEDQPSPPAGQE